jgi:hypothetical protein
MVKSTTHTFTIAANTDWHVARADGLGVSGALLQGRYRLAAGGTDGNIDIALITGDTPSTATSATINALPQDHFAYLETGKALVNSATVSARTNIQDVVGDAAAWLQRRRVGSEQWAPLLAVRGDGVTVGTVTVVLVARPFAESGQ